MNSDQPTWRARILVVLPLALVVWSVLYPQAAYPLHSLYVLVGLAALVLLAIVRFLRHAAPNPADNRWRVAPAAWLMIGFAVLLLWWWAVAWRRSAVPALGIAEFAAASQGIVMLLGVTLLVATWGDAARARTRQWAIALVTIGLLVGLHGLYQIHGPAALPGTHAAQAAIIESAPPGTFSPTMRDGLLHALREGRATGRFGAPNLFAGFLAPMAVLALALGMSARGAARRLAWTGAALVMTWGVVEAGSRGGVLAVVAGVGVLAVLTISRRLLVRAAGMAAIAVFLVAATNGDSTAADRWTGTSTVHQRFYYWQAGKAIWSEDPLFGRGAGAFEIYYPQARVPGGQETIYAHNWAMQWSAATGIIGVALFTLIALLALVLGLKWWRQTEHAEDGMIAVGFLAAGATLLLHGLVEYTLSTAEFQLLLGIVLGVIAGRGMAMPRVASVRFGVVAGKALIVAVLLPMLAWKAVVDAAYSASARDLADLLAIEGAPEFEIESAWERATRRTPRDPRAWEGLGWHASMMGHVDVAERHFARAAALHPNSARLQQNLSMVHERRHDLDQAIALQRRATELHPLKAALWLRLGELQLRTGDIDAARASLARTEGLFFNVEEQGMRARLQRLLEEATPVP